MLLAAGPSAMRNSKPPAPIKATGDLAALRRSARRCRACPLWEKATQTVFGEGPQDAQLFFIGEQAGDHEDLQGHPFVGPAGKLLDRALADAGVLREQLYITNVIKHFKFELRGKRRLHKRADANEIAACSQWLERELERVQPRYVVCLGAMAAHVMLGADFGLMRERGKWHKLGSGRWCLATVHPSYVLRSRIAGGFEDTYAAFVADLKQVRRPPRQRTP